MTHEVGRLRWVFVLGLGLGGCTCAIGGPQPAPPFHHDASTGLDGGLAGESGAGGAGAIGVGGVGGGGGVGGAGGVGGVSGAGGHNGTDDCTPDGGDDLDAGDQPDACYPDDAG